MKKNRKQDAHAKRKQHNALHKAKATRAREEHEKGENFRRQQARARSARRRLASSAIEEAYLHRLLTGGPPPAYPEITITGKPHERFR